MPRNYDKNDELKTSSPARENTQGFQNSEASQSKVQKDTATLTRASLELALAGALWGFGFVAAVWALEQMGPLAITGWRFAIAFSVGLIIALIIPSLRKHITLVQFMRALVPGILISLTLVTQTWGLQYTTATKSGFITTLYVLMVPLLERVLRGRRTPKYHVAFVLAALVGVALICDLPATLMGTAGSGSSKEQWNFGDFLTLVCAVLASVHIMWFGLIQDKIGSSFVFNMFQSFWAGALPLALSFMFEKSPTLPTGHALTGLMMLAFGSTLIAFSLQIRAQKVISPSLASLLFLLESPFAAIFALIFLNEIMSPIGVIGAALILIALGASTVFSKEVS